MASIVTCPSCQKKLRLPDDLLGQEVQCPTCSTTFLAKDVAAGAAQGVSENPPLEPRPGDKPRRDWGDDEDYGDDRDSRRGGRRDLQPHRGSLILTLGILSLVLGGLGLIIGPIAWILGQSDLRAIREGRMDPEGEGITNAGRICGIVGTAIGLVGLAFCCVWMIFVFGMVGMGAK